MAAAARRLRDDAGLTAAARSIQGEILRMPDADAVLAELVR